MERGCQAQTVATLPRLFLAPTYMEGAHRPEDAPAPPPLAAGVLAQLSTLLPTPQSIHPAIHYLVSLLMFFQSTYRLAETMMISLSCFFSAPNFRLLPSLFFI